jgi:hypothetical protein
MTFFPLKNAKIIEGAGAESQVPSVPIVPGTVELGPYFGDVVPSIWWRAMRVIPV